MNALRTKAFSELKLGKIYQATDMFWAHFWARV